MAIVMIKIFFIFLLMLFCTIFQFFRPVEIIAVHDGNTILVNNFPLFKFQKILWWEKNKSLIAERYGVPIPYANGYYDVFIQSFGEGYKINPNKTDGSEFVCFEDMSVKENCIDKAPLLTVGNSRNSTVYYW